MVRFSLLAPTSLADAATAAAQKGALVKAGGIDLLDLLKADLVRPEVLVNLRGVPAPELRRIAVEGDGIHLGALVTLAEVAADERLPAVLRQAAADAASPQIRNVATLGGNLCQRPRCWYFRHAAFPCLRKGGHECFAPEGENRYHAIFDNAPCAIVHPSSLAPPLLALGATLVTTARRLPVEEMFLGSQQALDREHVLAPGELITDVVLPTDAPAATAYLEAGERESFDWALVSASVALDLVGDKVRRARLVLGAVAPTPRRAQAAEAELVGKRITEAVALRAAQVAFADARPLSDNGYKVALGRVVLRRAILAAAGARS